MLEKLANVFRIPDLRKRILFTLGLLAVYRLGGHIPTPGVNADKLQQFFEQNKGSLLGFVDLFSGGQLRRLTIFALGIMPYITSSIILQLLTVVYEPLAKLQKEGELGRKKITQWTRYLTVILASATRRRFCRASRPFVHSDDHADPDHGQRLHHVAGRTDHRARRGQRHVAVDLCRHRGGTAARCHRSFRQGAYRCLGRLHRARDDHADWRDGAGGGFHRLRGTLRAPHSGAVCQARGGAQGDGRSVDSSAAAGKFRRRDAGNFRLLNSNSSPDVGVWPAQQPLFWRIDSQPGMGRAAVHGSIRCGDHLFRLLLCVDRLQLQRGCRQHAEVWGVYPRHSSRQAYRGPYQRDPHPHHAGGCALSDHHLLYSGMDDYRYSPEPSVWANWRVFRAAAHLDYERFER